MDPSNPLDQAETSVARFETMTDVGFEQLERAVKMCKAAYYEERVSTFILKDVTANF